jgi:glucose-6-phosphate isomerase
MVYDMSIRFALPQELRVAVDLAAAEWQSNGKVDRFWQKDPSLWTHDGEETWMGWLDIVDRQQKDIGTFAALAGEIKSADFQTVLLVGMGGSSLCPEVLAKTFGRLPEFPALRIIDSTDPVQVWEVRNEINLPDTLIVVASKSGSTLEPNILKQYFFQQMKDAVCDDAGSHFIAITDPGSKMEQVAKDDNFRYIFYGDPAIGGRYSALSNFGVVPATLAGLNIGRLLEEAAKATAEAKLAVDSNPAVQLGLLLGTAHNAGRDKITIFTSPEIHDLGAWLEQLIAESTGKLGKGITPVDRETIGAPSVYGNDRLFAYIKFAGTADASQDAAVAALEAAGHPVVAVEISDLYELFGQIFTWEIATAVAGSVMGINPFNQPDVESAKIETRALTSEYEKSGTLPTREPVLVDNGVKLYATPAYAETLKAAAPRKHLPAIFALTSTSSTPAITSPRLLSCPCSTPTKKSSRASATRSATRSALPPASASARASFTPPARTTRADRTRVSFFRSLPTTPAMSTSPVRATASASSSTLRPPATSQFLNPAAAAHSASTSAPTSWSASMLSPPPSTKR